jgi:hypothetical protein
MVNESRDFYNVQGVYGMQTEPLNGLTFVDMDAMTRLGYV